jgi:hypothetical protein
VNQGSPPPWPQEPPYAGPPGGPYAAPGGPYRGPYGVPRPLGSRIQSLGTLSLVLAILELLYCAVRVGSAALSSAAIEMQRAAMRAAMPPEATQAMGAMQDVAEGFARRMMVWDLIRTVPFVVATSFLLSIAVRLRKGDTTALRAARTWMFGALGVVVVSLLIQLLVTVPLAAELQSRMLGVLNTTSGKGPAIDTSAFAGITEVFAIASAGLGAMLLSTWPVVLYIWAGKLSREAQA